MKSVKLVFLCLISIFIAFLETNDSASTNSAMLWVISDREVETYASITPMDFFIHENKHKISSEVSHLILSHLDGVNLKYRVFCWDKCRAILLKDGEPLLLVDRYGCYYLPFLNKMGVPAARNDSKIWNVLYKAYWVKVK